MDKTVFTPFCCYLIVQHLRMVPTQCFIKTTHSIRFYKNYALHNLHTCRYTSSWYQVKKVLRLPPNHDNEHLLQEQDIIYHVDKHIGGTSYISIMHKG